MQETPLAKARREAREAPKFKGSTSNDSKFFKGITGYVGQLHTTRGEYDSKNLYFQVSQLRAIMLEILKSDDATIKATLELDSNGLPIGVKIPKFFRPDKNTRDFIPDDHSVISDGQIIYIGIPKEFNNLASTGTPLRLEGIRTEGTDEKGYWLKATSASVWTPPETILPDIKWMLPKGSGGLARQAREFMSACFKGMKSRLNYEEINGGRYVSLYIPSTNVLLKNHNEKSPIKEIPGLLGMVYHGLEDQIDPNYPVFSVSKLLKIPVQTDEQKKRNEPVEIRLQVDGEIVYQETSSVSGETACYISKCFADFKELTDIPKSDKVKKPVEGSANIYQWVPITNRQNFCAVFQLNPPDTVSVLKGGTKRAVNIDDQTQTLVLSQEYNTPFGIVWGNFIGLLQTTSFLVRPQFAGIVMKHMMNDLELLFKPGSEEKNYSFVKSLEDKKPPVFFDQPEWTAKAPTVSFFDNKDKSVKDGINLNEKNPLNLDGSLSMINIREALGDTTSAINSSAYRNAFLLGYKPLLTNAVADHILIKVFGDYSLADRVKINHEYLTKPSDDANLLNEIFFYNEALCLYMYGQTMTDNPLKQHQNSYGARKKKIAELINSLLEKMASELMSHREGFSLKWDDSNQWLSDYMWEPFAYLAPVLSIKRSRDPGISDEEHLKISKEEQVEEMKDTPQSSEPVDEDSIPHTQPDAKIIGQKKK